MEMVTLKDLYKEVNGTEMRLIAGEKGLNNKVKWVHMVENLEISSFLKGGEIIFLTGIGLNSEKVLLDLIKEICSKGTSGAVINIGPYIKKIPVEVIEFCNEHNYPLFTVPWNVHMAEITRVFCSRITRMEEAEMKIDAAIKNAIYFPNQEELYLPLLEAIGFFKEAAYCCSIIQLLNDKIIGDDYKKIYKITTSIELALFNLSSKSKVLMIEKYIIIIFVDLKESKIRTLMEEIQKQISYFLEEHEHVCMSVGSLESGIDHISESYKQAKAILKLQKNTKRYAENMFYSDLGVYKLLLGITNKKILHDYFRKTLEPLVKYDQINGTDYYGVLDMYLRNNGSVKEVAQNLYIHRNTVNYKLNKIEEILACDLSDLETRVIYKLSYITKDLM